jgi:SAM-dependent methyltransferase
MRRAAPRPPTPRRPILRRLLQAFVSRGLGGVCRSIAQTLARRLHLSNAPAPVSPSSPLPDSANLTHPFDLAHGTDTSGLIWGEHIHTGHRNDLWSTAYYGISPDLFTQLVGDLALDWQRFTFLDLGSGKGRALLLASRFPFRRILGIELSPQLNQIANANIRLFSAPWQQCHQIESRNADAATLDYPSGPLVLYLYNPFLAPVLKRCLHNLLRSLASEPREIYLIYVNPAFEHVLKKYAPTFQKELDQTFALPKEDIADDRFGSTQEEVVIYHHLPTP